MKTDQLKVVLVITGAVLFNIIFWREKFAVNALLFDVFILWSLFYLYPVDFKKPTTRWLVLAHLVTLAAVIIHNTLLSKLAFSTTLILVVIFTQFVHRSVWYGAGSAISNFILMLFSFSKSSRAVRLKGMKTYSVRKGIRFLVIPVLITGLFFILYSFANVVFYHVISDIGVAVQNFFRHFFSWFSWQRFGFLLLGLFITGGLLLKNRYTYFSRTDLQKKNELTRKRKDVRVWKDSAWYDMLSLFMGRFANGIMALKNEHTVSIISLILLNLLLLCINCLDIVYVWFGFSYTPEKNLTQYVHEGTGMLIFSIVLAILVLLFFFRGNLNFYKKNKWLRYGACAWIIQNAILSISVLIRDSYYIQHMGLAYKRIGVLVFLLMVLIGLATMLLKVQRRKSSYYLWRVNGWFAIILLVISSCIHWDEQIANYNLARKNSIPVDVKFLLTLSDKTLPLIEKNQDVFHIDGIAEGERAFLYPPYNTPKELFEIRKKEFFKKQETYSWLSWNKADAYIKDHLVKTITTPVLNN